jgi:Tfp pilus assembly protein PilO
MKLSMSGKWSEREQVVAVLVIAGAVLGLLWFFLLLPMNRQRHRLERDIDAMSAELEQRNFLLGEDALQRKLNEAMAAQRSLNEEWQKAVQCFGSFAGKDESLTSSVAHIEFKVELFDVRRRLQQKSRQLDIRLPPNLGVPEAVESDDDAYQRTLQLRVVERLVDMALDLKIRTVKEIRSLPPIVHKVDAEEFFREYPLELDLFGTQTNLYEFLNVVSEPGDVFVLRGLRVEPAGRSRVDLVNIKALMSGLVFVKAPSELPGAPPPAPTGLRRPGGH